jgi:putative transposase
MRLQALKARPRRRRLPPDLGERQVAAVAANVLDRTFAAPAPNRKWILRTIRSTRSRARVR